MIKDYGSYISWKSIYISNDLIDLYLPTTTILLGVVLYVAYKVYKYRKTK